MTIKYFAYGSNMLTERLGARCKSAQAIGSGSLSGYALEFSKQSRDGSGKCTIVESESEEVLGVVFEIAKSDEALLDRAEGFGKGYGKLDDVPIALTSGGEIKARAYIGENLNRSLRPYDWYRALVVAGAMQHGLPQEWTRKLERVAVILDQDANRRQDALKTLTRAGYERLVGEAVPA